MNNNPDVQSNNATGGIVESPPIPYVVCLLDILGQKEELAKWDDWPEDTAIQSKASSAWRKSVGVVQRFKCQFIQYFALMSGCTVPERYAAATPHEREIYHRYKNSFVSVQQFSDTFVFYTPLFNTNGDISVVGIHQILGACCSVMVSSLCQQIPIRGGVTIGLASELAHANLYGPALNEAHNLESQVAKYPRIVVSESVSQWLTPGKVHSKDPEVQICFSRLANSARSLICFDNYDNCLIVDFLGSGMRQLMPKDDLFVKGLSCAYHFVRSQIDRFEQEKNDKLACRYHHLMRYIKSRLSVWGLKD